MLGQKGGKGGKGGKGHDATRDTYKGGKTTDEELTLDPETVMMVIDPATKQKIPLIFKQTDPTTGRIAYIHNIGTKRDSYICMLFQKGRCKSHSRCNQIHADRGVVTELRQTYTEENKGASNELGCAPVLGSTEPLSHQRALEVVIIDPTDQDSRMSIPVVRTSETVGRHDFFAGLERTGQAGEARLCMHYATSSLEDREKKPTSLCPHGDACKFIHIEAGFLRFVLEPNKPCCTFHGVDHVVDYKGRVFMVNKKNQRCPLPLNRLMTTKGLRGLVTSHASLVFACNRVCKLHQEKRCQWGRECSNLHICREFYSVFSSSANPAQASLPSTPFHQILPNGKLKLRKKSPESVVGQPVTLGPQERYGIPLVTDEGPVQKDLLPEIAKKRYPDAPAILGTPMGMLQGVKENAVPEALQQVQEVDSEQGTPPASPLYENRPVQQLPHAAPGTEHLVPGFSEHVLPITTSTTSTLYTHPSFIHSVPPPGTNLPLQVPHPGMGQQANQFLPQTWSEYDTKGSNVMMHAGGHAQQAPQYFSSQNVGDVLSYGAAGGAAAGRNPAMGWGGKGGPPQRA